MSESVGAVAPKRIKYIRRTITLPDEVATFASERSNTPQFGTLSDYLKHLILADAAGNLPLLPKMPELAAKA